MTISLCIKRLVVSLLSVGLLCGRAAYAGGSNTPSFTSGNSNQVLLTGTFYSYQVNTTPTAVFSATGLPPGLTMSSVGVICGTPTTAGSFTATLTADNDNVSINTVGVNNNCETAYISSSTPTGVVCNDTDVYAGIIDLQVNGTAAIGFCIDPWHDGSGTLTYNWESLPEGPKVADGMGATTALEIEQLWDYYYSSSMSANTAAGLQIAMWELVDASISAQTAGYSFALDSSNNFGASSMISFVESNPTLPAANLDAVTTTNGQDYVMLSSSLPSFPAATATQSLPFTVYAKPVVTNGAATVPVGQPYSYDIVATNSPTSYSATSLPTGLSVSTSTGVISGTPTKLGTYTISLGASNPGATGTGTLTLQVVTAYTLTIAGSPSAGGTATGAGVYPAGAVIPISETANSGYRTNGWGGTNVSNVTSPSAASTTITMNGNKSITADYVQQATLTINSETGGTTTGAGTYDVGTTVPITETASSGYHATGWSGSSSIASPSSTSTTIVLSANTTISPSFVQQVTLAINSETGGTATGAGTYNIGTTVPITETASSGYRANGWSGSTSIVSPSSTSTSIVLNASATITPAFVKQVTLAINSETGGTTSGAGTYDVGTTVPITETANSGYRANGWSGSTSIVSPSSTSTSIVLNASATITPAFVQQVTLAINSETGGTSTGAGTYDVGTTVPITETANSGYRANGWSGSTSIASPSSADTSIVLNASATISPAFVQQVTLTINSETGGTTTGAGTYDIGTSAPITETASSGYRTNGWSGSSSIVSPSTADTSIVLNASATITPAFVGRVTLTINSETGGATTGAGTYDVGTSVPITETASSGYRTNGWSGSSSIVSPSSADTSIVLNASATITPAFVGRVTLTINSETGGTTTGAGTYDVGTSVPITETASSGYRTNGWSGSSSIVSPSTADTSIVLNSSATISPAFVGQVTLAINSETGGTTTGAGTYDIGTTVPITETASSGYRTNGWSGSSSIASPTFANTSIVLNASATITPAFVQQVTLTINSETGGSTTGAGTYDVGSTVPITETAIAGYRINGWSGSSGIVSPTNADTSIVLSANATISPSFVQQVTLTINSETGGSTTGAGSYDVGSTVAITESANSGYRTNGWSGSSSIASPSSADTSIVLNTSATISPAFVQQVTLNINSETGGTATGAGTYDIGSTVPITETASSGYRTNGWSGSSSIVSTSSADTSIVLDANATISPSFVQQFTLTVTSGSGGSATGNGTFDVGTAASIVATPATGYAFSDWTGASPASTTSGTTTITMTGNLTVDANFSPDPPSAIINAAATAYTGSPFNVTSTATAPADNLTLHSIEWLSPAATWTVNTVAVSGGTSNRDLGITFPTTGTYTLRAGASDDNGVTWYYSPTVQVAVSSGITNYTLESMAVPGTPSALTWFTTSPVVQESYEVQHVNPQ